MAHQYPIIMNTLQITALKLDEKSEFSKFLNRHISVSFDQVYLGNRKRWRNYICQHTIASPI